MLYGVEYRFQSFAIKNGKGVVKECSRDDFGLSIIWFMEKRGNVRESDEMGSCMLKLLIDKKYYEMHLLQNNRKNILKYVSIP